MSNRTAVTLGLILAALALIAFFMIPNLWLIFWLTLAFVHAIFAFGVTRDAMEQQLAGSRLYFVEPLIWGLATFMGGFLVVFIYWVFHHSILRRDCSA